MSICSQCTQLLPIDICATSIVIGTVPQANTEYNIYFKSLATDYMVSFKATSDSNSLLTLEPENGFDLAVGMSYEVYVNTTTSGSCGDNLTICTTTATCYMVEFERVKRILTTYQIAYSESYNVQEFQTTNCC